MNLLGYVLGRPTYFVDPTGESAVRATLPAAGGLAIGDGVLPFGEIAACLMLAGAATYDIYCYCTQDDDDNEKPRSKYRIGRRFRFKTKKEARERAQQDSDHGTEPIHHPHGEHGPHYHPNVKPHPDPNYGGPSPHDHYYYPAEVVFPHAGGSPVASDASYLQSPSDFPPGYIPIFLPVHGVLPATP